MQKNGFLTIILHFFVTFSYFFQFFHIPYGILHNFVFKKRFLSVQKRLFVFFPRMKIELPIFLLYNNHDTEVFP